MSKPLIYVLNGPNLNLLGQREPAIYGDLSLDALNAQLIDDHPELQLECLQSNHEGQLIDWLHAAHRASAKGVILNAGGYSHTSVAIRDAVAAIAVPVVEVHLSNVYAREPFRAHSHISPVAAGMIVGFGVLGYQLAIAAIQQLHS